MSNLLYRQILKALSEEVVGLDYIDKTIYILSDATLEPIEPVLRYFLTQNGIRVNIKFAPINTFNIQILDLNSDLYKSSPDFVLIHHSSQNLFLNFYKEKIEIDEFLTNIVENCTFLRERLASPILLSNFISPAERRFGSLDRVESSCLYHETLKMNKELDRRTKQIDDCFILDIDSLASYEGIKNIYSEDLWALGKIPFNYEFFVTIGERISAIIRSKCNGPVKCIVLDLDNTLWGGVIGDDGSEGIILSTEGEGELFYQFQLYLKSLKNRGIVLAIASKNELSTALHAINNHPAMVLKEIDFSSIKINWRDKAANIIEIAKDLNILVDSILFIDDNQFEREQVKSVLPSIQIGEFNINSGSLIEQISNKGFFETNFHSKQDGLRSEQYLANKKRDNFQNDFQSIDAYLGKLAMKAIINPITLDNIDRVVELTHRTNQFNLRTKRYSRQDYLDLVKTSDAHCFTVNLSDRFGDYGLIAVIVLKLTDGQAFIDQWLTSCRVVSRTLDEYIMNYVAKTLSKLNCSKVVGEYIITKKNGPVKNFYRQLGFDLLSKTETGSIWSIELSGKEKYNTFIEDK